PRNLYCTTNQHFFDLADGMGWVQPLRTDISAVHDGVATEQAVRILEVVETLASSLVAAVSNKAICLQKASRTNEFVGVPPERRAGGRATSAQNALVETIELFARLGRLQTLFFGWRLIVDQERLDRMILIKEMRH